MRAHFFIGIALVAIFWYASWTHLGILGEYAFLPQWLGYILTVDALVALRRGNSLITQSPRHFVFLFLASAPIWWLFEMGNNFTLNWHYLAPSAYSIPQMILQGSVDFSTVLPAVLETTMLLQTFALARRFQFTRVRFKMTRGRAWALMYIGAFSFLAVMFFPKFTFPLLWLWLFLLIDPLNYLRGRVSLIEQCSRGDLRMGAALALATLVCGFFWELWNFYAMPKWYYTVPYVGFAKIFEMPLLGYSGYLPFGWELYALYHLVWGIARKSAEV